MSTLQYFPGLLRAACLAHLTYEHANSIPAFKDWGGHQTYSFDDSLPRSSSSLRAHGFRTICRAERPDDGGGQTNTAPVATVIW